MLTIILIMLEFILIVNLFFLMLKLKNKSLTQEFNIAVSAIALVGITIVITFVLRGLSGY